MPDHKIKRVSKRNMKDPLAKSEFDEFKKIITKQNREIKAAELKKRYEAKLKKEYEKNKKNIRKKYKPSRGPLTPAQKRKAAGKGGK